MTPLKFIHIKHTFFLLLFAFPFLNNAQDLKLQPSEAQMDEVFKRWNDATRPGIAAAAISNGKIVYKNGFGSANLEHQIPITNSTIFNAGTWNRQFTAFAILLLENQGKLSLQDDIRKYVTDVPDFGQKITLHHLLSHTSGLDDYAVIKALAGWNNSDVFTKKHAIQLLKKQKQLNNPPGEKYQMNQTDFMLLEEVVAKVSRKSYAQFTQENIFQPLGMNHTFYLEKEGQVIAKKATGYRAAGENFESLNVTFAQVGPSDLYTNIDDILKWIQNFRTPKVGNAAINKKMDTPALLNGKSVEQKNGALYLGQHRYWNFKGTNKLYLIGDMGGYACKIVRFPDQDFSAVVMGNDGAYNGYSTSNFADLFLEKYYAKPSSPIEPVATTTAKVISKKLSKAQLQKMVGTYYNSDRFFTTKIELVNDTLRYREIDFNWGTNLEVIDENNFRLADGGNKLELNNINGEKNITITLRGVKLTSDAYSSESTWSKNLKPFTGKYYSEKLGTTYSFEIKDGELVAIHERLNNVVFQPITKDAFKSNKMHYNKIVFSRDKKGRVNGFHLSNRKIKNLYFEKTTDNYSMTNR